MVTRSRPPVGLGQQHPRDDSWRPRDLFYEVGFHGTTVRDIAGRVGVTVPALYYHHGNKEGILAALLDLSITSVTERCEQALIRAGVAAGG